VNEIIGLLVVFVFGLGVGLWGFFLWGGGGDLAQGCCEDGCRLLYKTFITLY